MLFRHHHRRASTVITHTRPLLTTTWLDGKDCADLVLPGVPCCCLTSGRRRCGGNCVGRVPPAATGADADAAAATCCGCGRCRCAAAAADGVAPVAVEDVAAARSASVLRRCRRVTLHTILDMNCGTGFVVYSVPSTHTVRPRNKQTNKQATHGSVRLATRLVLVCDSP